MKLSDDAERSYDFTVVERVIWESLDLAPDSGSSSSEERISIYLVSSFSLQNLEGGAGWTF